MTWAYLFSPCLIFPHPDRLRERDADGKLTLVCPSCGNVQRQLTATIITGPKHRPERVPGQPTGKARVVVDDNVVPFERQSQR